MAKLQTNSFSSYVLSVAEEEVGQVLNDLQVMVLQNKRAIIAQDKLNIIYKPSEPLEFAQQVSYLQGQLDVIQWLLDTSNEVALAVKERSIPQPV